MVRCIVGSFWLSLEVCSASLTTGQSTISYLLQVYYRLSIIDNRLMRRKRFEPAVVSWHPSYIARNQFVNQRANKTAKMSELGKSYLPFAGKSALGEWAM